MFEIGLMLFGAKRWFFAAFKALLGNRYFWLATGLIVSLWLAWAWHTSTVAQASKNATQAEYDRMVALHELAKTAAIDAEKRRAQKIIDANKEHYEQQRQTIQARADRLLTDAHTGLCACASPSNPPPAPSAAATQAALNQIPARLLQTAEPNYLTNLSDFLSAKPSVPTGKPSN